MLREFKDSDKVEEGVVVRMSGEDFFSDCVVVIAKGLKDTVCLHRPYGKGTEVFSLSEAALRQHFKVYARQDGSLQKVGV